MRGLGELLRGLVIDVGQRDFQLDREAETAVVERAQFHLGADSRVGYVGLLLARDDPQRGVEARGVADG